MTDSARLSAHDTVFLYWERPEQPMHLGECMVYDGHVSAAEVIDMLAKRLHLLPRYIQRIVSTPLGLGHPIWVDDPDFDLSHHVDERVIPAPGDDVTMSRYIGDLYCELLERNRPLWHITVLQGHESGGTVLFIKLHHSMVDGVSSVELLEVLHSDVRAGAAPTSQPRVVGALPSRVDLLRLALADTVAAAGRRLGELKALARPSGARLIGKRALDAGRAVADVAPKALRPLSPTPFNGKIHAKRDFAWVEVPFDDVTQIRRQIGGTVNDVVLAVLAGAIRRYMDRAGSLRAGRELVAMCPVSVRTPGLKGEFGGNKISMVMAPLFIGVDDASARLLAESTAMMNLKERGQASGFHELISLGSFFPPPLWQAVWKLWPHGYFPLHLTSTNVPGPREPLFLGKHELLHWYPFGVQWTNNGLFLCTISYRGRLVLAPVVDPDIADVWAFADDLESSFVELHEAATAAGSGIAEERKASARTSG